MKEPKQCKQTLDSTQSLTNPSLSVAGSFVTGLETSSPLHQSKPVCAKRKLAGFADKSIFVAPTQTQTRDGFSFDIISQSDLTETPLFNVSESVRTRTTQVSDTGTSQSTSTGRNSYGTEIGTRYRYIDETPLVPFSENGNSASSTSAAGAKTRSRPSNEYVLYSYGEPVAMTADGNASYFGTDILGSVRNVTDKYGSVQANYNYDAFGSPYLSNLDHDIGFGYCGKVYDNGTGLYDYGFRDYSPVSARFTTIDPIRDGNNWFSYVVNDPVNYVDLWGLKTCETASDAEHKRTFNIYPGPYTLEEMEKIAPHDDIYGPQLPIGKEAGYAEVSELGIAPPVGFTWDDSSHVTSEWDPDRPSMDADNGEITIPGHNGMDFDGQIGTRINSVREGRVVKINDTPNGAYGKYIEIQHPDGTTTKYAHLSRITVYQGQLVEAGYKIGEMGNTGKVVSENGDGSHLHLGYDGNGDGVFSRTDPVDDPARLLYSGY